MNSARKGSFLRVLDGAAISPPPVWLMRQAGRYLPEYRRVRQDAGSFLDLCFNPDKAVEVTLQPIERFDFDAAILFSDILVIPHAMGRSVRFVEGEGPRLDPIGTEEIARLSSGGVADRLKPVMETVAGIRARLPANKALIGFCGAPWTVATYMVAGRGTPDQAPARLMAAGEPESFQRLIDRLVEASADYLVAQLRAGADCVQIFESWGGSLDEAGFERWCVAPAAEITRRVRAEVPGAKVIGFVKGAGLMLERYVKATGVDAVGIDWTVPIRAAAERLTPLAAVQGNLDPVALVAGGAALDAAIDRILEAMAGRRFIFNVGHGIRPETPPEHVARLVSRLREKAGAR